MSNPAVARRARASDPEIVVVVAVADNGVIGLTNGMPWRLPSDLARFKALTMNRPLVMGRRTFQSIGRPLPGRTTIVLTRDPAFHAEGAETARNFGEAICRATADARMRGMREIMVVGGGDVYAQALPYATRIEATRVHARPTGDVCFPPIDPGVFRLTRQEAAASNPADSAPMTFETYIRATSNQTPDAHET